jgi:hypothetical protein
MYINLKKISKKRFKECGWKYIDNNSSDDMVFEKKINGIEVTIALYVDYYNEKVNDLDYTCIEGKLPTPNDLVVIANEVKRLEEK